MTADIPDRFINSVISVLSLPLVQDFDVGHCHEVNRRLRPRSIASGLRCDSERSMSMIAKTQAPPSAGIPIPYDAATPGTFDWLVRATGSSERFFHLFWSMRDEMASDNSIHRAVTNLVAGGIDASNAAALGRA